MSVLEKANELGQEILASEEYQNFRLAQEALEADADALALMEQYRALSEKISSLLEQSNPEREQVSALNDEVLETQQKLLANEVYMAANQAHHDFSQMMDQVNRILRFHITGEVEEEGCGGDCSGCGGSCGHHHAHE